MMFASMMTNSELAHSWRTKQHSPTGPLFCAPPALQPKRRAVARQQVVKCGGVSAVEFGGLKLWPPVIQVGVKGWTEPPYRKVCHSYGLPLCMADDVHVKSILESGFMPEFEPSGAARSVRLFGGRDVGEYGEAAAMLVDRGEVEHIDVDFGGFTEKLLKQEHGAALTRDHKLVQRITERVVGEVGGRVAVTAGLRLGISWVELTYPRAGYAVCEAGVDAILVNCRTARDKHATNGLPRSGWPHAMSIVDDSHIPVLLEGDIYTGADALKAMKGTGCAGVVIGLESIGRPWLFGDLKRGLTDGWASEATIPSYTYVARTVARHLTACINWKRDEQKAVLDMRKWYQHYFDGYNGLPHQFVVRLCKARTVDDVLAVLDEPKDEDVGFEFKSGFGRKMTMELPAREPPPKKFKKKKRKSASQRGPVTLKGNIEKLLREKKKKVIEEKDRAERRRRRREEAQDGLIR